MSFNTQTQRKIKDVPLTIVMRIPSGSSIVVSSKVGETFEPMKTYTESDQIEVSGNGSVIQVTPTGVAEFELF